MLLPLTVSFITLLGATCGRENFDDRVALDLHDFALVASCRRGPSIPDPHSFCRAADFDGDADVDLRDLAWFQNRFRGQIPPCGDGTIDPGEECDDGNDIAGDGCARDCSLEPPVLNDSCWEPAMVGDALATTLSFSTIGATTDGIPFSGACPLDGEVPMGGDVWFVYAAGCNGTLVVSLCGTGDFDTELAVYGGTGCPTDAPLACSDDDCGVGFRGSRVEINATEGQVYLIRVGTADAGSGGGGHGTLTILCNVDVCAPKRGSCGQAHADRGCGDEGCCEKVCNVDPYCCDVAWDNICAAESPGLCSGSFEACGGAKTNSCHTANTIAGCGGATCCNEVCGRDPFCCIAEWDDTCAGEAADLCP